MARKPKEAVDYFPHPVKNGTKMFIMEQTYGDKGYLAYYKLLEFLGKEPGHFVDFTDSKNLLYFSAEIRADRDTTLKIIGTLAEIGAIDLELWNLKRIVWCQSFVDKIAHLYEKRRQKAPEMPGEVDSRHRNDRSTVLSAPEIPHSIVKDSKEKKRKGEIEEPLTQLTLNESFFRELPNSPQLEVICMQKGIPKDWILSMIEPFKKTAAKPSYPNFNEFTSHFGNWIQIQCNNSTESAKQKVSKSQSNYNPNG